MKKTIASLALAAGIALGATACAGYSDVPPESVTQAPDEETYEPAPEPEPVEEEPAVPDVLSFGDVAQWDGVEMGLSKPKPFQPSEWSAGAEEFDESVVFEVTLTNTGTGQYDPSMAYLSATSGGVMASEIFDNGVGDVPTTPVLPGKSVTWKVALNVADPAGLVVEVSPGLEFQTGHEDDLNTYSAVFTR